MNQVGLVGRFTRDPVLRTFPGNRVQTNFIVAINRNYRNNEGNVDADFVTCIAWGRLAERVVTYCGKGSLVGVHGRLQTRSFTNKDNIKIYTTEVVADDVRFFILKQPENKGGTPQHNLDVTTDFVLPEQMGKTAVP
ncbi:single-stranded DNA-binding protein [Ureibacillus sinduriensis BLB-1 = JCM 15800]|uniref:Single-stranded DNA-binding protein n=2 Tax=Ureibacillus sinduriensis TaxID=561440 RepID=A0A0A3HTS9_9BACL|nr:single-stranded DNA-binding protein [Ureibacillus sinduriensis BLB-1 = JCM 15800]